MNRGNIPEDMAEERANKSFPEPNWIGSNRRRRMGAVSSCSSLRWREKMEEGNGGRWGNLPPTTI
jgi:hypothetical protein